MSDLEANDHYPPSRLAMASKQHRHRGRNIGLGIIAALAVIVLAIAGFYWHALNSGLNSVARQDTMPSGDRPAVAQSGDQAQPLNIALMGSDSRGADQGRSDVLQIMHISADHTSMALISIPRDLWVNIPGYGNHKINAAYAFGGPALTVKTLESLLNVRIDHTVEVDFSGFSQAIDTLGGVTVNNRIASSSAGTDFPEGQLTLNGADALTFVRERKDLPGGDFDRTERQRDVIKAVFKKLASTSTLANPSKFSATLSQLGPAFTVDQGFTNTDMVSLAYNMRDITDGSIQSILFPNAGTGTSFDGQSIVLMDDAATADLAQALKNDTLQQYVQNHPQQ